MGGNTMRKGLMLMSCLLAGVIILSGTAYAEWMWAQGNVAQIQYPADCTYLYLGWGLQMEENGGTSNWIHMPIPSKAGGTWGARSFKLQFSTGSADAWVSDIDVWNGAVKVKAFPGLTYSNGWKTVLLDMGKKVVFSRGMSVSIKINAGEESMSHQFIFSGAGANFVQ
jgi:hypothetical protein